MYSPMGACKFMNKRSTSFTDDSNRAIVDGRVGIELVEGYAITFEFATSEIIAIWPKLSLPNIPLLVDKVSQMESPKIKMNVSFE